MVRRFALVVLWGFVAAFPAARADAPSPARQQLTRAYAQMEVAFEERDRTALLAFFAPSYQYLSSDGEAENLDTVREAVTRTLARSRTRQMTVTLQRFVFSADRAVVTRKTRYDLTIVHPITRKTQVVKRIEYATDRWVQNARAWRMTETKERLSLTLIDGEPARRG